MAVYPFLGSLPEETMAVWGTQLCSMQTEGGRTAGVGLGQLMHG
jgi:hypothetical protein